MSYFPDLKAGPRYPYEQKMWFAVLLSGIEDQLAYLDGRKTRNNVPLNSLDGRWMQTPDFEVICSLAGVDPDFILDAYNAGKLFRGFSTRFDSLMSEKEN